MADTLSTTLSDAQVSIFNQAVMVSGEHFNVLKNFATFGESVNGESVRFTIYSKLTKTDTVLTDGTEATAEALTVSKVEITPEERGKPVVTTRLANATTAGQADVAAATMIGINKEESTDYEIAQALEAGTNTTAATLAGTLAKGDLRARYTTLTTRGIMKFGSRYIAVMHPNQAADLKDEVISISQYTDYEKATSGIVGQLEGFTIVEDANVTDGTVLCFGQNAFGEANNVTPDSTIIDLNDNLGRKRAYGWYGIYKYDIVDQNALEIITGA